MKGLITLIVIAALIFGGIHYLTDMSNEDPGLPLAVAFGNADKSNIEVHLALDRGLVTYDGPKVDLRGNVLWDEWIDEHFALVSDGGEQIPLRRMGDSPLMPEHKLGGLPEGTLIGKVQCGKSYAYNVLRHTENEPKLYRYSFTAPSSAQELKRPKFALTKTKNKGG